MPTVLREQGFRVIIYTDDHAPPHVHVCKDNSEARISLGQGDSPVKVLSIAGKMSNKDIAKALTLVKQHQTQLREKWGDIHGSN